MNVYFADAFYFVALMNRRDQFHGPVKAFAKTNRVKILTTPWVLVEAADSLAKPVLRPFFGQLMGILTTDPSAFVLPANQLDLDTGIHLYLNRPDKAWSLTDCISFEVMKREGIAHALTGDKHFVQAGFTIEFP